MSYMPVPVYKAIVALVGKEAAGVWWTKPNKAFDNKTPEAMYAENPSVVATYLLDYLQK